MIQKRRCLLYDSYVVCLFCPRLLPVDDIEFDFLSDLKRIECVNASFEIAEVEEKIAFSAFWSDESESVLKAEVFNGTKHNLKI